MSEISHLPARPFRLLPGALLRGWMARRAFRRSQRHLLALDRHLLRDIGLTRAEAEALATRTDWDAPGHWRQKS